MYIGKVSELTGATPKAIRHYEAIGLIPPPKRLGKYRHYSEKDIRLISMIKHAQKYGFQLSELKNIIAKTRSDNNFPYDEFIEAIEKKRIKIGIEISNLVDMDNGLVELSRLIKTKKCSC
jgi:MerR family transcriptional regulator, copper efflux regulator